MARYLVQSKFAAALKNDTDIAPGTPTPLAPGHMRLFSYYKPSLQAARYAIEAVQTVTAVGGDGNTATITRYNTQVAPDNNGNDTGTKVQQEFEVVAPQFSLDPKLVNTYYPPDGHSDEGQILPHIVFNDPHVPWFRPAGNTASWMDHAVDASKYDTGDVSDDKGHNFMPWLALLVFQPEDLVVSPDDATSLGLLADGMQVYDPLKLPANGAYQMTVGHYLSSLRSRVYYEAAYNSSDKVVSVADIKTPGHKIDPNSLEAEFSTLMNSTEVTTAIFPTKAQLKSVFGNKDSGLGPLEAHRLLSHVRQINTVGFPDAGVEEEGFYSVVISSMTGNVHETLPTTHIVHLVSLEHIDSTLSDAKSSLFGTDNSGRIGLVSLLSWTYTCIPESVNFKDRMIILAKGAQPLQPPQQVLKSLQPSSPTPAQTWLHDRLSAGYTIARWRAPTGEESVAFNRGPLVPVQVQDVPSPVSPPTNTARSWPALSMTGKDYAVFDEKTGMMDLTYSAAWSLGKLEAISDSIFNAALMRFRSSIWKAASSTTRMFINNIAPKANQVSQGAGAAKAAAVIVHDFKGPVSRINNPANLPVPPSMDDPNISKVFREAIDNAIDQCASAGDASGSTIYNGFDTKAGNNSDWEILLNWVHDVMFLASIPAHVLFPEPSHLMSQSTDATPDGRSKLVPEALRFFYIDHAWIDCFLDGALSVANHLEPEFDYTRLRVKAVFNHFLNTPVANTGLNPPVPRYGFILRSAVVKATPDLRLSVIAWASTTTAGVTTWTERDCLVRHTKLDESTIFSLVDCLPEEIRTITMSQPPHQQRFSLQYDIDLGRPSQSFKTLYTDPKQAPPLEWPLLVDDPDDATQQTFYTDQTRCIHPAAIATSAIGKLKTWSASLVTSGKAKSKPYDDDVENSCVLGLELNDPAFELKISGPNTSTPSSAFPPWHRQLWLGNNVPAPFTPRSIKPNSGDIKNTNPPASAPITTPVQIGSVNSGIKNVQPPPAFNGLPSVSPRSTQYIPKYDVFTSFQNSASPNSPSFELIVHPDYHATPVRPMPNSTVSSFRGDTYSPQYYVPTNTAYLYDLTFAIRRRDTAAAGLPPLQSITIEIPVNNTSNPTSYPLFEPLLDGTDYSGTGVAMSRNTRFVPTLYSGSASNYGAGLSWTGIPVLGVILVPRSSSTTGTIAMANDERTTDVSFRITQPRVTPVVKPFPTSIATYVKNTVGTVSKQYGRTYVRMTEHYFDGGNKHQWRWSWCVVIKRDLSPADLQLEVDMNGKSVGVA